MSYKIFEHDPYLKPFESDINLRMDRYYAKKKDLVGENGSLVDFANGHLFYGFHKTNGGWFYREWAPSADEVFLTGDFNGWNTYSHKLLNIGNGNWEIFIEGENTLFNGCYVKTIIRNGTRWMQRIPLL